jgi:hypothetical protein
MKRKISMKVTGILLVLFLALNVFPSLPFVGLDSANAAGIAPTGLTATSGDGQVTLTWNAAPGAMSYSIYQSTISGSGYQKVNNNIPGNTTTATISGLMNGVPYYFAVTSSLMTMTMCPPPIIICMIPTESDKSNEASTTPHGAAPALTGIDYSQTSYNVTSGSTVNTVIYAIYANGDKPTLTSGVTYSSEDTTIATVDETTGIVTGIAAGTTVINATYQAESATTHVTVTAVPDASLNGLNLSGITLDQIVSGNYYTYTATVANNVSATSLTYTTVESHATADLQLNGIPVNNPISLNVGSNIIKVVVTAQDGTTTKTYTVTVTRAVNASSDNASLNGLNLSGITLDQIVSGNNYTYTATVANNVSVTSVTYTTVDSHATAGLQMNGIPVNNPVSLNVGSNIIKVVVTAQDGTTTKTYTVTVTRAVSGSSDGTTPVTPTPEVKPDPKPTTPPLKPDTKPEVKFNDNVVKVEKILANLNKKIEEAKSNPVVEFKDTTSHWSEKTINIFVKLGVVNGYPDGSFHPEGSVTRAEFATIIAKVFDLSNTGTGKTLSDAKSHWASSSIAALTENGIISGYDDGTFKPDREISRAEIISIISKILNFKAISGATTPAAFTDIDGSWNKDQIEAAASAGIISGHGNGHFDPNKQSSRAEALTIILHSLKANPELGTLLDSIK